MYTFIKKKIIKISEQVTDFVRDNLVQIIIIGGSFVFLEVIKSFPYVNIIPSYQFLVIGFVLFLTALMFRQMISDKIISIFVIFLLAISVFVTIFEQTIISDVIGFVIFVLLLFVVLKGIASNRKDFKKEINE